jgi:hypothetical protein
MVLSSAAWLVRHIAAFQPTLSHLALMTLSAAVATTGVGLWLMKAWAYWAFVAILVFGLGAGALILIAGDQNLLYFAARVVVFVLWLSYASLPHVRRAFRGAA